MRKLVYLFCGLCLVTTLACNRNGDVGAGVGDAEVSGGTGGEGAGPTGTQGDTPAENPAADDPTANGTGTDAPSP